MFISNQTEKNFSFAIGLVFVSLVLSSCNTMLESATQDPMTQTPYVATKNEKGETVHVRERVKSNYTTAPIIYPQPIYPTTPAYPDRPSAISKPEMSNSDTTTTPAEPSQGHLFLEHSSAAGHSHLGLHYGFGEFKDHMVPRIGMSLFGSEGTTFAGFDGSMRGYAVIDQLRPFVGAGFYLGDSKKCTDRYELGVIVERCEKKFLSSGFVEAGLEYKNFSVFWRDYAVNRAGISVPTRQFFGIGLRF